MANLDDLRQGNIPRPGDQRGFCRSSFYASPFCGGERGDRRARKVGALNFRSRQAVYVDPVRPRWNADLYAQRLAFEWVYGAAAVITPVFHDVLITLGLFSLLHFEISLTVIAALLTLVGYSMNDTIVIFDRIRENTRLMRSEPFADIVNKSINQTLSRTILTKVGWTFLTVLVLFVMGGQVLQKFFICVSYWNSG